MMTKYKYKGINRHMTTEYHLTLSPASRKKTSLIKSCTEEEEEKGIVGLQHNHNINLWG